MDERQLASPDKLGSATAAWALYDFGYALFVYVVFARYLSDWLIIDQGFPDHYYTTTQAVTALTLFVLMPAAGAFATRIQRHVPVLAVFTVIAAASSMLIGSVKIGEGLSGALPVLALGGICAAATGLAFAQFDPLLPRVAPRHAWGLVSGIATAAGYLGIIVAIAIFGAFIIGEGNKQDAFAPAGMLLLVFLLPLLLLVREPRSKLYRAASAESQPRTTTLMWRSLTDTSRVLRTVLRDRPVARLLAGRFLYTDAVGTLNIYLVVYISRVGGFSEGRKDLAILLGVVSAGIGGLLSGLLVKRWGPRRTLRLVLPLFTSGLLMTAAFGAPWTIWVLAPVIGLSLGTVATADRVFMLALTPEDRRGEYFGIFNLIGRVAQAAGPFIFWGGVIWLLHSATGLLSVLDASRVALALLGLCALAGLAVISSLDDRHEATIESAA